MTLSEIALHRTKNWSSGIPPFHLFGYCSRMISNVLNVGFRFNPLQANRMRWWKTEAAQFARRLAHPGRRSRIHSPFDHSKYTEFPIKPSSSNQKHKYPLKRCRFPSAAINHEHKVNVLELYLPQTNINTSTFCLRRRRDKMKKIEPSSEQVHKK